MYHAGLVLEGGGMRGLFTAGVLDCFLEHHLHFPLCIGVSAGAGHACSYVCGQKGRARDVSLLFLDDKRYCSLYSLVTTGDLFGAEMLYKTIPEQHFPLDTAYFNRSLTKFYTVITNCVTGEAEYPQVTDLMAQIDYVRASASLPLVSRKVQISDNLYLDGGIADSIPIEKARALGFSKNVVVLTREKSYRKTPSKILPLLALRYRHYPALRAKMETRHNQYNRTLAYLARLEQKGEVFLIRPTMPVEIRRTEKNKEKLLALYQAGYTQAQALLPALLSFLTSKK